MVASEPRAESKTKSASGGALDSGSSGWAVCLTAADGAIGLAGRLKWDDYTDGVCRDTLVFDLLRAEWLEARDAWRGCRQASSKAQDQLDR